VKQRECHTHTHTHTGQEKGRDGVMCAALLLRCPVLSLYSNVVCKGAYTGVSSQKSSTGREATQEWLGESALREPPEGS
jgi:hypothetical protein